MKEMHGRCSCGSVEYRFSSESLRAYQCHCTVCQKATGSAFTTTLMVSENDFSWIRGNDIISSYEKESGYRVSFCSRCGNPVPNKFRDSHLLAVPAGNIEGNPEIGILAQLYLGSRATWDHGTREGRHFDQMPTLEYMFSLLGVE